MKFDKKLYNTLLQFAITIILFTWLILNISGVVAFAKSILSAFSPFILGLCIAFIINIIMKKLECTWDNVSAKTKRKPLNAGLKRAFCMTVSFLLVFGVVLAIVLIVVPEFSRTISGFMEKIPQYTSTLQTWWNQLIMFGDRFALDIPAMNFDLQKMIDSVVSIVSGGGKLVINTTINFTTSFISGLVTFFVALIFSIYVLSSKENYAAASKRLLYAVFRPETVNKILEVLSLINRTFTSFVTGQLTEAVIIGVLCFIGMLIFAFPYALVISILVGFTALIPVFGAFIGTGIGAFLILLDAPIKALWFVIFIIVLQQIEGNLIYPKVVGKSVGLPALFVLMAVIIGADSFGIVGMLISVPVFSVCYTLISRWVDMRVKEKHI